MEFYLKVLGNPELYSPAGTLVRFKTRSTLALLVVLRMGRRSGQRREWLADLLWGRADEEAGLHSLSVALSELRAVLGREALTQTNDEVFLRKDVILLDLDDLRRPGVEVEVEPVLGDFTIQHAANFEHWLDAVRAEYWPALIQRGVLELSAAKQTGDLFRVSKLADRLLRINEFSEDAIAARCEVLAALGDRMAALRAFAAWQSNVVAQLERAPSPELTALVELLLQNPNVIRPLIRVA